MHISQVIKRYIYSREKWTTHSIRIFERLLEKVGFWRGRTAWGQRLDWCLKKSLHKKIDKEEAVKRIAKVFCVCCWVKWKCQQMDLLDDVCECASAFLDCYFHVVGIICRRWDRGNEDEVNKRVGISWKEKERRIYIFVTSSFTVLYTRFGVYFSTTRHWMTLPPTLGKKFPPFF